MLILYIKSVIIYFIIFLATKNLGKFIIKNRTDINYKDYMKNDVRGKISTLTIVLIPILRIFFLIIMFVTIFGSKELLDKIFNKEIKKRSETNDQKLYIQNNK